MVVVLIHSLGQLLRGVRTLRSRQQEKERENQDGLY
jgi:hypothetical protein